jgi:hypothetical protein
MKKLIPSLVVFLFFCIPVFPQPVGLLTAEKAVDVRLKAAGIHGQRNIRSHVLYLDSTGSELFFLFHLSPRGFMIITGRRELPPALTYSFTDDPDPEGRLVSLAKSDLIFRLQRSSETIRNRNRLAWDNIVENQTDAVLFQQWPEPGTTSTGGWLETNWTQNSPYNLLCPMDLVTSVRSLAGCPAVAMAQIVNFHHTINGVYFGDTDDYHHNYQGRNYMIDDDYSRLGFPSFPELNGYLDTLQISYNNASPLKDRDKAALTFACGVAATQVFTSSASGTFGVGQALEAYQKFNFDEADLLIESNLDLYSRMSQNIKDTLPVHLAIVDPAWSMGHNVVVDGYNTDEYYHLNFGWGGSYNAWYLLPSEIPYGLTVIEGAIVDIIPDFPAGIANQRTQPALFHPNPACEKTVISAGENGYVKAELYSPEGRLLRTIALNREGTTLDLSDFCEGLYLVRMYGKDGVASGKLMIRR